ncbi:hypothetical protein V490_09403 [Pseudogymnoascus sp. VKM F-3557]|nr:hypothetical protein V490_09403 [Pseudogymnoascus sp. VKM F-3557]
MGDVNDPAIEAGKNMPRLLPHVVDEIAASEPSRPYIYQPKSSYPGDGWVPVTFKELANAIDHVAHIITETVKKDSTDEFPTLAYVGPSDVRYTIVVLASVKAGCQALLISPRNSIEGQLSLFEGTKCCHIWYAESFNLAVKTWLSKREMKSWIVPPAKEWLQASPSPVPYSKSYDEARWDPLVVMHTSGSTGHPKPIVVKQGGLAVMDSFLDLPEYMGGKFLMQFWKSSASRIFLPMPLFHAAGLMADQPTTVDLTIKCLQCSGCDAALLAPSIVEELSIRRDGVEALKRLRFVGFGGGNLSTAAGDSLIEHGVVLNNCISSTEVCPYALYSQPQPKLWQYFIFNSKLMGAVWQPHDPGNGIYELVIRRKDPKEPHDQSLFYTFPDLATEWSTRDLFKAHPTLKDHWMFHGRADNIIVFSNGEKLNPVTIEDCIVGHPLIKGAVVVGQDRFQPALILEPASPPKTHEESEAIIESVWPLIIDLNKETVAHGRISKQLVVLSDPDLPFPRAPKGTVQRSLVAQAYRVKIDEVYKQVDTIRTADVEPLDIATVDTTLQTITKLFTEQTSIKDIKPDTDFFVAGVDSLQVSNISRSLRAGLAVSGAEIDGSIVAPRAIYSNPTLKQLAEYLHAAVHKDRTQLEGEEDKEISLMKSLISRYTADLPVRQSDKPKPLESGQTVVLTGSTGSLGAYLLDILCNSPHIKAVVALNRGADGGKSRQPDVSAARGLGTDFSKVEFLSADLSQPDLGLGAVTYKKVLAAADRIIHNAWPVNFNMTVASFEPSIRGVRHLVDLSAAAAKQVPITFLSTIDTISNWNSSDNVPESRLTDLSLPETGYGRSKLVGSFILDAAAEFGVPSVSIRVGQIAGPHSTKGKWNTQEFMPSLIKSSVYLGVLPQELGPHEVVDWMPIEDVTGLILDVSGITQSKDVSEISGYMHCINPQTAKWADLAVAIKDFFSGRVRELVTLEEWVSALEKSAAGGSNIDENPAIKLLPTYQGILTGQRAGRQRVHLDMERTVAQSTTAGRVGPVTTDLMRNWSRKAVASKISNNENYNAVYNIGVSELLTLASYRILADRDIVSSFITWRGNRMEDGVGANSFAEGRRAILVNITGNIRVTSNVQCPHRYSRLPLTLNMGAIKNVAIAGGSGLVGKPVVNALLKSGKFTLTALVRESSTFTFPSGVKVVKVDFDSVASLTEALKGQDALVSTIGNAALQGQNLLVDAAVAAGVSRFLPSDFGSNIDNPKAGALPVFGYKVATANYSKEKAASNPSFTYTFIRTGAFLDNGLEVNALIDWQSGKPVIYDSGDQLLSTTTLEAVGQSVVGVLTHPEETKNKAVYVQSIVTSQNKLLDIVKKLAPGKTQEPQHVSTEDIFNDSNAKLAKGDYSEGNMFAYILVSMFGEGYGAAHETIDNEVLGVTSLTEADVEALLKSIIAKRN